MCFRARNLVTIAMILYYRPYTLHIHGLWTVSGCYTGLYTSINFPVICIIPNIYAILHFKLMPNDFKIKPKITEMRQMLVEILQFKNLNSPDLFLDEAIAVAVLTICMWPSSLVACKYILSDFTVCALLIYKSYHIFKCHSSDLKFF